MHDGEWGVHGAPWILSFGAAARVVAPERLAASIRSELDAARAAYSRRLQFPMLRMVTAGIEAKELRSGLQ